MSPKELPAAGTQKAFSLLPGRKILKFLGGDVIFSQGEVCTDIQHIQEGLVTLTTVSKRGRGAVVGILGPGDFLGEECLSSGDAIHQLSANALLPTTLIAIRRRTMARLIEQDRQISGQFIKFLLQRNRRIEEDLIDRVFNSSEKRLARTLLLLNQYGKRTNAPSLLTNINQDTLADMVGTTRSRVNFFMNKFRKLGFIRYNGGLKVYDSLHTMLLD